MIVWHLILLCPLLQCSLHKCTHIHSAGFFGDLCAAFVFLVQATWNERKSSSSSHTLSVIGAYCEANQQSNPWQQSRCRDPVCSSPRNLPLSVIRSPGQIGPVWFQNNDTHVSLPLTPSTNPLVGVETNAHRYRHLFFYASSRRSIGPTERVAV